MDVVTTDSGQGENLGREKNQKPIASSLLAKWQQAKAIRSTAIRECRSSWKASTNKESFKIGRAQFSAKGKERFGVFIWQEDPLASQNWIAPFKETFKVIKCLEEDKVAMTIYYKIYQAKKYWTTKEVALEESTISRKTFKETFLWEFF